MPPSTWLASASSAACCDGAQFAGRTRSYRLSRGAQHAGEVGEVMRWWGGQVSLTASCAQLQNGRAAQQRALNTMFSFPHVSPIFMVYPLCAMQDLRVVWEGVLFLTSHSLTPFGGVLAVRGEKAESARRFGIYFVSLDLPSLLFCLRCALQLKRRGDVGHFLVQVSTPLWRTCSDLWYGRYVTETTNSTLSHWSRLLY